GDPFLPAYAGQKFLPPGGCGSLLLLRPSQRACKRQTAAPAPLRLFRPLDAPQLRSPWGQNLVLNRALGLTASHTLSAKFPCMCPVHPHMSAGRDFFDSLRRSGRGGTCGAGVFRWKFLPGGLTTGPQALMMVAGKPSKKTSFVHILSCFKQAVDEKEPVMKKRILSLLLAAAMA